MSFSTTYSACKYRCVWFFDIACHFYLMLYYPWIDKEWKMFKNYPKKGGTLRLPFRITWNVFSCGLGNFLIIYQQNMIMPHVNTEITSKHCDAMIFFPHTQGAIYHFKGNHWSRMFFTKAFNSIFQYAKDISKCVHIHFLLSNNAGSPNLNTK